MNNFFTWLRIQRLKAKLNIVKAKDRFNATNKRRILIFSLVALVSLGAGFSSVLLFQLDYVKNDNTQKAIVDLELETPIPEINESEDTVKPKNIASEVDLDIELESIDSTRSIDYLEPYVKTNKDTVGYIKIEGTQVDYPVVQADDNKYYMNRSFSKLPNVRGSIFMDYRCDAHDFSKTRNTILYGHRMKNGTMFKGLIDYQDEDFFNEHRIIQFDTIGGAKNWEVFAVFRTTTDFYYIDTDFPQDEMWVSFLKTCYKESMYKTAPTFSGDDIVLTLSTCTTSETGRFVVMAKLIVNEI